MSCNLGCGSFTCGLTDIAQNQILQFNFNQPIDPSSVDFSTISLRTTAGIEPSGELIVSGQTVTFVPAVRTVEGQNFFGFEQNATYSLAILGGPGVPRALSSTSGDRLTETYACSLDVTLGLVDLNPGPPVATVVSPLPQEDIPVSSEIIIEFDEILDATQFIGTTVVDGPVTASLRPAVGTPGNLVCADGTSASFPITGTFALTSNAAAQTTFWTFRPDLPLPTGACLEISVSSAVRDLAGISAVPVVFRFLTEEGDGTESVRTETFDDDTVFDPSRSSGSWGGGVATFGRIGGDGRHGDFDITDGVLQLDGMTYVFDTDAMTLTEGPGTRETEVVGGEFQFANFVLPAENTVRFEGSNPAIIRVAGECRILGTIDASGGDVSGLWNAAQPVGQPGGTAGPGGGAGGDGAFASDGLGNPTSPANQAQNFFNGFDGEDLQLPSTHLGAGTAGGTGGRGAPLRPAHGDSTQLSFLQASASPLIGPHQLLASSVGGGGGFITAGGTGTVQREGTVTLPPGGMPQGDDVIPPEPGGAGGAAFDIFASFDPALTTSLNHFVVGGSGGGGGGSNVLFSMDPFDANMAPAGTAPNDVWWSGGGGGGGGGALALRVGANLTVLGSLLVNGGTAEERVLQALIVSNQPGASTDGSVGGSAGPGGGGSGGSLLMQVDGAVDLSGSVALDVRGGGGSIVPEDGPNTITRGVIQTPGDGAPGALRLEVAVDPGDPAPTTALLPAATFPAPSAQNVAPLLDTDDLVVITSDWYVLGTPFPPTFTRYEIDVTVGGVPVSFTDTDLATAAIEGQAIRAFFQGATIDALTGEPIRNELGEFVNLPPWRRFVSNVGSQLPTPEQGVSSDASTGYRFQLVLDRAAAGTDNVTIEEVRVFFR